MRMKNLIPEAISSKPQVDDKSQIENAALYAMKNGLSGALKKFAPAVKLKNITPSGHKLMVTAEGEDGKPFTLLLGIDWIRMASENIIANDTASNREIISLTVIGAKVSPPDSGIFTSPQCPCGGETNNGVCIECGSPMENVGEAINVKMSPHDYKIANFIEKVGRVNSFGRATRTIADSIVKVLRKGDYAESVKLLKKNPEFSQYIPDGVIEYIYKRAGQHKDLKKHDKFVKDTNWSEMR